MKYFTLILTIFCSFGNLFSQTIASGYYISKNSDTINARFKLKKGGFGQLNNDLTKEIIVLKSNGDSEIFMPSDIKGYEFTFEGIKYQFFSKPTNKGVNKFLTPVIIGPKTSLFQYGMNIKGNGSTMGSNQVFYTFEKSDGTYLFLTNILNKKFKNELKEFYKEYIQVENVIDAKLNYWIELQQDLYDILSIINNL